MKEINTLVIGGGITGLSTAHFLKDRGISFSLFESSAKLGGVIQTVNDREFIFETGPNTVLNNNSSIDKLLRNCNLMDQIVLSDKESSANRYVFFKGQPTSIPASIYSFIKTPILSSISKLKFFLALFLKGDATDLSVYDFSLNTFGKEFHDNLVEPILNGIYAGDTRKMSTKYSLRKIWAMKVKYGRIIIGLIKSRKANSYSFNFPMGLSQMINAISKNLAGEIKLNTKVEEIKKKLNGYEILTFGGDKFFCENVICTIPAYALSEIVFDKKLAKNLKRIEYNPIDVFHFAFREKDIKSKLNGFGILAKPSDKKSFLGVLFSSNIFPHLCPNDYKSFTVLVGGEKQKRLLNYNKTILQKLVLEELKSLIDCETDPVRSNYISWDKAIPQYNFVQSDLEKAIEDFHKHNENFKIIGNYFSGVSVSDCVQKGEEVVKELF